MIKRLLFIIVIILLPISELRADAINPILNIFNTQTAVSSSMLMIWIILVESIFLKIFIDKISYLTALFWSIIVNIASSTAGSVIVYLFFKDKIIWEAMSFYIPMFVLTMLIETSMLTWLYKHKRNIKKKMFKISFKVNAISYISIFIFQIIVLFIYLGYGDFKNNHKVKNWNNYSLLENETGFIYTIKDISKDGVTKYVFNQYDVKNRKWKIIDPKFENGISLKAWDIKAGIIACIAENKNWKDNSISVIDRKDFLKISEIKGDIREIKISPDLSKLAVFEYQKLIRASKDDKSDFMLGIAYKLKIYDLNSGILLSEAPRLAIGEGLTWTNDSLNVIFSSLLDNSHYLPYKKENIHPITYGRNYAKIGEFPIDLFMYNLKSNSVTHLIRGRSPNMISDKNEITFMRENPSRKYDLWRMDIEDLKPYLVLKDIEDSNHKTSPSGNKYLIKYSKNQLLSNNYFLTITSPNSNEDKLIIIDGYYHGAIWNKE